MNQMPIARRKPHRPRYSDDDDTSIARDGEVHRVRMTAMDSLQRSVFLHQDATGAEHRDGSEMRR